MSICVGEWRDEVVHVALTPLLGEVCLFADATGREVCVILEVMQQVDGEYLRSITYGGKPTSEFATLDALEEMHCNFDCRGMEPGFFDTRTWQRAERWCAMLLRGLAQAQHVEPTLRSALIVRAVVGVNDEASCRRWCDGVPVTDDCSDGELLARIRPA